MTKMIALQEVAQVWVPLQYQLAMAMIQSMNPMHLEMTIMRIFLIPLETIAVSARILIDWVVNVIIYDN